jgi:hypothetical protein
MIRMAITISGGQMTSDLTPASCEWRPDPDGPGGAWVVSTLPGRRLTRAQAQTALLLAEVEAGGGGASQRAAAFRSELGL